MTDGWQIERGNHEQEFVVVGNSEARDGRLSFRARGLHHHLLSLPPGWRVTTVELAEDNPEGRDAIRTALNELVSLGYVTKRKHQDKGGHWHTIMTVHGKPQPKTDFQAPATEDGFPGVGKPGVGGSGAIKKTVTKNGKDQKKAPRRAEHSVHGDNSDIDPILDEIQRAAERAYGDDASLLTADHRLHLYRRFCCRSDGTPREIEAGVYAYLVGGPFSCVPTLAQALEPLPDRSGISRADIIRFNDPDTEGGELIAIVEGICGPFGPGVQTAVENMIMDSHDLRYIVNAVRHGTLHIAV